MNRKKIEISVRYLNALVLPEETSSENKSGASTVAANMMTLGFIPSNALFNAMTYLPETELVTLQESLIPVLEKAVGANVKYEPMYPNFPQQVMEMDDMELFLNAIIHYWTLGEWMPTYEKLERSVGDEDVKLKELGLATQKDFDGIFTKLLGSNDSISETDKKTIKWFVDNNGTLIPPKDIPFKENLCYIAGVLLEKGMDISEFMHTATDVLRVITYINGGDISLAANTKFKSMPRPMRKMFVSVLEKVARQEDIDRHRGKWVRLFHTLHVGDYSESLYKMAQPFRENKAVPTFNGRVSHAIRTGNVVKAVELLGNRPGDFTRRLDHLLRLGKNTQQHVVDSYLAVANNVPTRTLIQVLGHLKTRHEDVDMRVVFPKGSVQRATIVDSHLDKLPIATLSSLASGIVTVLMERFSKEESLGKVYIDPRLERCPLPAQQRSASEGLKQVARGTRLPIGDKGTLRFFIYWVGQDIDLSATFHDENLEMRQQISYTNLRDGGLQTCHSGDITRAPKGASEFIDVTIDPAVDAGFRYAVMNVYVFSGPTFKEHEACYAGWMTRSKPRSNEIYQPKTVEQKIDLVSDARNSIPVIFDLVTREAIWADLTTPSRYHMWGNNVHSNRASISQVLTAMTNIDNRVSLYELFLKHAVVRGDLVETPEEADTVFSLDTGITPFDITTINADFIK